MTTATVEQPAAEQQAPKPATKPAGEAGRQARSGQARASGRAADPRQPAHPGAEAPTRLGRDRRRRQGARRRRDQGPPGEHGQSAGRRVAQLHPA